MSTRADRPGGGVLVFSEQTETLVELLTPGRDLAARLDRPLSAVAIGRNTGPLCDEALSHGADEVLVLRTAQGEQIIAEESLAVALCEAIRDVSPAVVLVGATRTGTELAASAAQRLQLPCVHSC